MYTIVVEYTTGNTFGSYETETDLDLRTPTLEEAQENLRRIKAFTDYYNYETTNRNYRHSIYKEEIKKPECFVDDYLLNLISENSEETKVGACWCGYFERLNDARIEALILEKDEVRRLSQL